MEPFNLSIWIQRYRIKSEIGRKLLAEFVATTLLMVKILNLKKCIFYLVYGICNCCTDCVEQKSIKLVFGYINWVGFNIDFCCSNGISLIRLNFDEYFLIFMGFRLSFKSCNFVFGVGLWTHVFCYVYFIHHCSNISQLFCCSSYFYPLLR